MNYLSERTKVALGTGVAVAIGACTIWASVSASQARTETMLSEHDKRIQMSDEQRIRFDDRLSIIDARTARIEGILEEMRRK